MTNQIKTIQLSTGTWLLVEAPKGQSYFDLFGDNRSQYLQYNVMTSPGKFKPNTIALPEGHTYTLIGKASELTEEQWGTIVRYRIRDDSGNQMETATISGLSLLKSQGMDIDTTVILKQND